MTAFLDDLARRGVLGPLTILFIVLANLVGWALRRGGDR